jgi:hypothetical protein
MEAKELTLCRIVHGRVYKTIPSLLSLTFNLIFPYNLYPSCPPGLLHSLSSVEEFHAADTTFVTRQGLALMILYSLLSGFAGVFSEKLLKSIPGESLWCSGECFWFEDFSFHASLSLPLLTRSHTYIYACISYAACKMYVWGVLLNVWALLGSGGTKSATFQGFSALTWVIIFSQVCSEQ